MRSTPPRQRPPASRPDTIIAEASLLAVSLAVGLGTLRLTRTPGEIRLVAAVVATVASGHLAVWIADRGLRRGDLLRSGRHAVAFLFGTLAVALVTVWVTQPSATRTGIPTLGTLRSIYERFSEAGTTITSRPTPLPATPGVTLCLVAGAGLIAVSTRALWGWRRSKSGRSGTAAIALVPSLGLFAYCALLSSEVGRGPAAIAYMATAIVFLVVDDRVGTRPNGELRTKTTRPPLKSRRLPNLFGGSVVCGLLALTAVLGLSPVLSGMALSALPAASRVSGSAGSSGQDSSASSGARPSTRIDGVGPFDLIDNMSGILTGRSQQLMFDATTPVATYWQIATLSVFDGTNWTPDSATQTIAGQLFPDGTFSFRDTLPVLPAPPEQPAFTANVSIAGLSGRLLPVVPTTISVYGPGVQLVPGIGAVYEARPRQTEEPAYAMVASTPLKPSSGKNSETTAVSPSALAPYLQLPSIPKSVSLLASQIVAGTSTPAEEATAIVRWFSNNSFRYTLTPPQVRGLDPLEAFLFVSKAGFCQQFAGAYAVLARLDGLPTRLAVGFDTGTLVSKNLRNKNASPFESYRVTGADAHVWPQVYLGPETGWVSFEPTPPANGESVGVGIVAGSGSIPQPTVPVNTPTSATVPTTTAPAPALGNAPHPTTSYWRSWEVVPLIVVVVLGVGALMVVTRLSWVFEPLRRRARERTARRKGPSALVLARFDSVESSFRRAGLARMPSETLDEHVRRVLALGARGQTNSLVDYRTLTYLAERASYGFDPCSPQDAAESLRLSEVLRRGIGELRHRALLVDKGHVSAGSGRGS